MTRYRYNEWTGMLEEVEDLVPGPVVEEVERRREVEDLGAAARRHLPGLYTDLSRRPTGAALPGLAVVVGLVVVILAVLR